MDLIQGPKRKNEITCAGYGHTTGGREEMSDQEGAVPLENRNCPTMDTARRKRKLVQLGSRMQRERKRYRCQCVQFNSGAGTGSGRDRDAGIVSGPRATGRSCAISGVVVAAFADRL